MRASFFKAFQFVIAREGGYVNDPSDPGGETKFGISKRAYPDLDIANLTEEDARGIYLRDYWTRAGCDEAQPLFDIVLFDAAVNQGVGFAKEMAHECDGDENAALMYRLKRYSMVVEKRPASLKYLRGWLNRILELYAFLREVDHAGVS